MPETFFQRLSFAKGLDREWDTDISFDTAKRLINLQPQPDGGLRLRHAWDPASRTGIPGAGVRKPRSIGYLPVPSGFATPIRRQRTRRSKRGQNMTTLEASWYKRTNKGSLLLAFVVYAVNDDTDSSDDVVVTPPGDWTLIHTKHSGNAPTVDDPHTVSIKVYAIEDAAERQDEEIFTFATVIPQRAQIELLEWHGVDPTSALDVSVSTTGFSVKPDTGFSAATDATVPRQLVIAAVGAVTGDQTIKLENMPEDYYDFRDQEDPPQNSVGKSDFWLNTVVARKIIAQSGAQRFFGNYNTDIEEEDAASRWVAVLLSFRAKDRSAVGDKDYYIVANRDDANTHGLYKIDLDQLTAGAWSSIGTLEAKNGSVDAAPLMFATGNGGVLITSNDVMENAVTVHQGLFRWDGLQLIRINRSPRASTVAFHRGRFYAAGDTIHPHRIYYSAVMDETFWDMEYSYIDAGGSGERVFDMCSLSDGLLIAKRDSLYLMVGPASQPKMIDLGAGTGMPGRCICRVPGGAIVVGENHVWAYQGGAPELISRALDDWWVNSDRTFAQTAFVNGLVYLWGGDENSCVVLDTESGAWWIDKPPYKLWGLFSWDQRELVAGIEDAATEDWLMYKRIPGSSRIKDGFPVAEVEEVWTQEYLLGSPAKPCSPIHLWMSYEKVGYQAGHPAITVTPYYDGVAYPARTIGESHLAGEVAGEVRGNGDHRIRLDVGEKGAVECHKVQFRITYPSHAANTTAIHFEGFELEYQLPEAV